MQYPQKDLYKADMDWREFKVLLAGLGPKTPLGQIISIRSEEDPNIIDSFTPEQKRIRDVYRSKMACIASTMSDEERKKQTQETQQILSQMFG